MSDPIDRDKWVNISVGRNRDEANLVVAKLRGHGIAARVDGEEMGIANLFTGSAAPFAPNVHVLQRDAGEARAILDEVERRRLERLRGVSCPKCGQVNPDREWPTPRLVAAALVLTAVILAVAIESLLGWACALAGPSMVALMWPYTPRWRCKKCGQRWIAPSRDEVVDDDAADDHHETREEDAGDPGDDEEEDDDEPQAAREEQPR